MFKKNIKYGWIFAMLCSCTIPLLGQSDWKVPTSASEKLSIKLFDEDTQFEGRQIYNASCISCHGTPGQANFTPMAPPPGDVVSDKFKSQLDGELLYKIKKGRGAMPSFENTYTETELWSLISYLRSFHEGYKQHMPNMEGIAIPVLKLSASFDENVDKVVVKVKAEDLSPQAGASVTVFLKGMFGNQLIGKSQSNELGIAYFDFDAKTPGDLNGNVTFLIKASKGYGSSKMETVLQAATPTVKKSAIEGRHLWSTAGKAPIWMIVIFNLMGAGIWLVLLYIMVGLRKIKKLQ